MQHTLTVIHNQQSLHPGRGDTGSWESIVGKIEGCGECFE